SATAIYGSRGSNGVILITTKQGRSGRPEITFNLNTGISTLPSGRRPEFMDGEQYTRLQALRSADDGTGLGNIWADRVERQYWLADTVEYTDWFDEITRTALSQQANISMSGGNNGTTYSLTAGYDDQEGIINNSSFTRYSARLNLNQEIGDRIKIGLNSNFSNAKYEGIINDWRDGNVLNQSLFTNPFIPRDFVDVEDITDESQGVFFDVVNTINEVNNSVIEKNFTTFFGKIFGEIRLAKGLKFYSSFGINQQYWDRDYFFPTTTRRGRNSNGYIEFNDNILQTLVQENRLTYNTRIKKHRFNFTAVSEVQTRSNDFIRQSANNIPESDLALGFYGFDSGVQSIPNSSLQKNTLASFLGRLNYSFNDRYLITASLRADGSSKFADGNKWGYFPSAAFAWRASEEPFIKNMGLFSTLKFRASFGITGNEQIPPNRVTALIVDNTSQPYSFGGDIRIPKRFAQLPNPNLKWEISTQYDFGFDVGFFDNRLSITFDYYSKLTEDLLLDQPVPTLTGFATRLDNVGRLRTRGIDLEIRTVNVTRKDFTWETSIALSGNRAKVLDLGTVDQILFSSGNGGNRVLRSSFNEVLLRVGDPVGIYNGYVQGDVINTAYEQANGPAITGVTSNLGTWNLLDVT
ncbi:MAG: SusC/RagA family TonB-linked outer membrane protein, partial [Bacteroidota bacterium]